MRVVAWNANYNRHRRALEDDVAILRQFDADVLVISEAAPPQASNPCGAVFVGETPGLAVISRDGVTIEPCDGGAVSPCLSLGFRIVAPWRYHVVAVWPVCFVSCALLPSTRYRVCDAPSWAAISDHRPVVLDVDEPAGHDGQPCGTSPATG